MHLLRLLAVSIKRQFLEWMGWRAFLITLVVNQTVAPLLGLAVWSVALPGSTQIPTYYMALLIVQLMTVSYEQHTFSNGLYDGTLSHELLKPQPVVIGLLGTNIAARLLHVLIGLPIILIVGAITSISFAPVAPRFIVGVLLAIPAVLLAAILRFLFMYLLALSAFWTERAHGVAGFGETLAFLLGGSAAPIPLFPQSIRPLGELLPFRYMLGFPAEIASGSLNEVLQGYGYQVCWIGVFALAAIFAWRAGLRRFMAVGG
ncbi:MAG TPA: ABC-2 family transporter protein [Ktedonobacteraceae bacterium]|nr:ABC-2 family transporter protein [Ktedonobacteraceae bacterium]